MRGYKSTKKLDRPINAKINSERHQLDASRNQDQSYAGQVTKKWSEGMARREHDRFVEQLKKLREESGWSLRELAERAKIDHSQLQRLESGERTCTLETAINIIGALGVKLEILADD